MYRDHRANRRSPSIPLLALALMTAPALTTACASDGADQGDDHHDETGDGDGDGDACSVTLPTAWDAPEWETNAAEVLALRGQLDVLVVDTIRAAEEGTVTVDDVGDLQTPFEEGDPSLADVVTDSYRAVVVDAFAEFVAIMAAGSQDLIDDAGNWAPGADGGIFGDDRRGLNEGGLEVGQLVDKGLFGGAALYHHALSLTEGPLDETTIDALAASWGANAMLDSAGELTDSANYGQQMGFHAQIADALIAAKAYAADPLCTEERDEAIREFFNAWELSLLARLVYYTNAALAMTSVATTDTEFADALHELGEGLGLGLGFHGLPDPASGPMSEGARVITDADLEAIAVALGVDLGDLGASTTGELIESVPNFESAQAILEQTVQAAYGLDSNDIQDFRSPTPG